MKRILILYEKNKFSMTDFEPVDYTQVPRLVEEQFGGKFPNVGNKVWLQAIVSLISTENVEYEFGYENISADEINEHFDFVLMPLANCFHAGWIKWMKTRTEKVKQIRIPVFVIACGVQANSYEEIDELIAATQEPATEFIKSVYNTGGEWALRGYFTYEYFKRLGFPNAVVTGCPSLFQMGRDLVIPNMKVSQNDFRYAVNGDFNLPIYTEEFDTCDFICQGNYGNMLFNPAYFNDYDFSVKRILKLIRRGQKAELQAMADNRIKVFADTQEWLSYYVLNNISFSFGSRIHGTVMPILAGTQSLLCTRDARTREMAEFFEIPFITPEKAHKKHIYDWYLETDYTKFNKNFKKRFDDFQSFMIQCGLVDKVNENNIFMSREKRDVRFPESVNLGYQTKLKKKLKVMKPVIRLTEKKYNC